MKRLAVVFLLTAVHGIPRCVEIMDAGVLPIIKGHIGLDFFVTVNNRGPDPTEVEVKMVQCCEDFPGGLTDCSNIHLIPETRVMEPNTTRNFTLIHPTLYPYNRRGECLLAVHYVTNCNRSKEARQHIAFDTTLSEDNVRCQMLRGFPGFVIQGPRCRSYDEDALDRCKMVDCHKKYFGLKSYFNKGSRTCEPVPACLPTKRRSMPDIVYDVTSNQCRDLTCSLTEEDLQHLTHADLEPECPELHQGTAAFINCHHGEMSNVTGDCACDRGYQQAVLPEEPGYPRTQVFHSCNVDNRCWSWDRFLTLPDTMVLVIASILVLIVFFMTLFMIGVND